GAPVRAGTDPVLARLAAAADVATGAAVVVVRLGIDARIPAVRRSVRAGAEEALARLPAVADDATPTAVVVVVQEVGAGLAIAAGLVGEFAALAAAGLVAIHRVAAPTGVVAESRPVPANPAGVTALAAGRSWRPWRPGATRLCGGGTHQRPRHEQDRDQPKETSSYHGFPPCWSPHRRGGTSQPTGGEFPGRRAQGGGRCHATGRHGDRSSYTRRREGGSYDVKTRGGAAKPLARARQATVPARRSRGMKKHAIVRSADRDRSAFRRA